MHEQLSENGVCTIRARHSEDGIPDRNGPKLSDEVFVPPWFDTVSCCVFTCIFVVYDFSCSGGNFDDLAALKRDHGSLDEAKIAKCVSEFPGLFTLPARVLESCLRAEIFYQDN